MSNETSNLTPLARAILRIQLTNPVVNLTKPESVDADNYTQFNASL